MKYVEQELAKKRGRSVDESDQVESDVKNAEDELYKIPEHLKVSCLKITVFFPNEVSRFYSSSHAEMAKFLAFDLFNC